MFACILRYARFTDYDNIPNKVFECTELPEYSHLHFNQDILVVGARRHDIDFLSLSHCLALFLGSSTLMTHTLLHMRNNESSE